MSRYWNIAAVGFGLVVLSAQVSCGRVEEGDCSLTLPDAEEEPFEKLSEYCFFEGEPSKQHEKRSEGVVPYQVRSKLYSDRSDKFRFIVLPDGATVDYDAEKLWSFPEGTIIVKTFYYPHDARSPSEGRRLLETRLMMKRDGGWEPQIYHWDEKQEQATREPVGEDVQVDWIDESGEEVETNYRIPNETQCKSCHDDGGDITLLGPRTRQLNRTFEYEEGEKNQIAHMDELGVFDEEPGSPEELDRLPDPKDESLSIETRARAYLEGNCAHCHNPTGGASNSGLFVQYEQEDRRKLGVCKQPVAVGGGGGGRTYDIKPGFPEESIMVFRMKSNDPEIKMPELPLRTVDEFGVEVVSEWIAQMEPRECGEE